MNPFVLVSLLGVFSFTALLAQVQGETVFDKWDKDKNGKLSKDELPAGLQKNFDRVDSNKDGWISREEDTAVRSRQVKNTHMVLPKGVKKIANLDYAGTDNPRQKLDIYQPESPIDKTPLPLVCWIHGGGWAKGEKTSVGKLVPFLKSQEYVCASIGYRLTDESQWPSQLHDCKAAIRFLKANAGEYQIDPERIVVIGSSAGGHLVAMLGLVNADSELEGDIGEFTDQTSSVTCVVNFFGPTDLLKMNQQGSKMDHNSPDSPESKLIGGPIQENQGKTKNASPIYHVSADDKPMLIIHGTNDSLVPYQQSVDLEAALEKMGVDTRLITVTDGGHGQGFPAKVNTLVKSFVDFHLLGHGSSPEDQKLPAYK